MFCYRQSVQLLNPPKTSLYIADIEFGKSRKRRFFTAHFLTQGLQLFTTMTTDNKAAQKTKPGKAGWIKFTIVTPLVAFPHLGEILVGTDCVAAYL